MSAKDETPSGGKDASKARRREDFIKSITETAMTGNVSALQELMETGVGPLKTDWAALACHKVSFQQYVAINTLIVEGTENASKNPLIWYLLSQELNFRAFFADPYHYCSVLNTKGLANFMEFFEELRDDLGPG